MRLKLWSFAAVMVLGLANSAVDAFSGTPLYFCPPCCCVTYQPKVVTCYKAVVKDELVPVVVQKVTYREERTKVHVKVNVPRYFDETVQKAHHVVIPQLIEREIKVCVMVPVPMFDPCACCCYMTYRPTYVNKTVQCTVYDHKVEVRTHVIKVCRLVQEDRVVEQCNLIPVTTPETVMINRRTHVLVPFESTVLVPVVVCK